MEREKLPCGGTFGVFPTAFPEFPPGILPEVGNCSLFAPFPKNQSGTSPGTKTN